MLTEIGHGLSADVPTGWTFELVDGATIQLEPPSRTGTAHITAARRRQGPREPTSQDARDLLARLPVWRERVSSSDPVESEQGPNKYVLAHCVGPEGHHWDVGVLLARGAAAFFTFNSETPESEERDRARAVFLSIGDLDR